MLEGKYLEGLRLLPTLSRRPRVCRPAKGSSSTRKSEPPLGAQKRNAKKLAGSYPRAPLGECIHVLTPIL